MVQHNIPPVFDENSRILILGSFPSVKSRETEFFYGHPQNRFWKVLAGVLQCPVPDTIEEKKAMLYEHGVALWDVIGSCEIHGSSDASIRNVVPNDLTVLFQRADIRKIYTNGNKSTELYNKYLKERTGREAIRLPSTSPANAAWSLERLISAWQVIVQEDET